jgi:hypothetical protein
MAGFFLNYPNYLWRFLVNNNAQPVAAPAIFGTCGAFGMLLLMGGLVSLLYGVAKSCEYQGAFLHNIHFTLGGVMAFGFGFGGVLFSELASVMFNIEANTRSTKEVLQVACKVS